MFASYFSLITRWKASSPLAGLALPKVWPTSSEVEITPFIQYTYARIQSVLRKAAESGIVIPEQIPAGIELSEKEEGLIQMVADFAAVVKQAGEDYSPSIIANYTYDLVKEYNQFYHDFSILREENEAVKVFRIALSANVAKVVRLGMGLLGIEVPSRM